MEIRADEISRILREQIKTYGKQIEVSETVPCCPPATASPASMGSRA